MDVRIKGGKRTVRLNATEQAQYTRVKETSGCIASELPNTEAAIRAQKVVSAVADLLRLIDEKGEVSAIPKAPPES